MIGGLLVEGSLEREAGKILASKRRCAVTKDELLHGMQSANNEMLITDGQEFVKN